MGLKATIGQLTNALSIAGQAFGDYKSRMSLLVALGFLGGVVEGLGVNVLIPLFSLVAGEGAEVTDTVSKAIAFFFEMAGVGFGIQNLLIFILILFAVKAVLTVFISYVTALIQSDYEAKTRYSLFKGMLDANWQRLSRERMGNLESILMVDVEASARLLYHLSRAVTVVSTMVVYVVIAINISWEITALSLVVGGLIFLVLKPLFYRAHRLSKQMVATNKSVAHHVSESVLGIKAVKVMLATDAIAARGRELFDRFKQLLVEMSIMHSMTTAGMEFFAVVFICGIFAYFYLFTAFNFGVVVALIYLIRRIFNYIEQLQRTALNTNRLISHVRSVTEYRASVRDNAEVRAKGGAAFVYKNELVFDAVSFAYEDAIEQEVLRDISFSIPFGETLGIIGPSGSGKSTFVDMMLRLLEPTGGEMLVDGVASSNIDPVDWRTQVGYVPQEIFLMNDTVANNIRFFRKGATDEEIEAAARQANIYDFIQTLPRGFDTKVGDRGSRLSVGQRQRIAIARALLRKPKLLILDEATSALDNESEAKIQETLESLKGSMTIVTIAHRLSTIMDADRLVVFDDGKLVEVGSPEELLADKGSYFFKVNNIER